MRDRFILGRECKYNNKRENHILIYQGEKYILERKEETMNKWVEVQFFVIVTTPLKANLKLKEIYEIGKGAWRKI